MKNHLFISFETGVHVLEIKKCALLETSSPVKVECISITTPGVPTACLSHSTARLALWWSAVSSGGRGERHITMCSTRLATTTHSCGDSSHCMREETFTTIRTVRSYNSPIILLLMRAWNSCKSQRASLPKALFVLCHFLAIGPTRDRASCCSSYGTGQQLFFI